MTNKYSVLLLLLLGQWAESAELTVDVDEESDVDWSEAVRSVADEHSRVVDLDVAYPQHTAVDTVMLPAQVDRLAVLGPRHEGRRRWRVDRAGQA